MDKDALDPSELHDPLHQNLEENTAEDEIAEEIAGTDEVISAEESAIHEDTETALDADEQVLVTDEEEKLEEEVAELDQELVEDEKKHKNRESTSEKAKKAATKRVAEGKKAEPVSKKVLDPLRLRGKKYREVAKLVDKTKLYTLDEAVELVKKTSTSTFDAAVELHIKVKGDMTRGTVVLPHGTGKTKKVAIADDATLEKIAAGKLDFDVLLATPAQMPKLAKFAKVLGPKGLMPSPKAGTVTEDIDKVKEEIGGGRVEYRADKNGVIHLGIGRVSFADAKLVENFRSLESAIQAGKMLSVSLASTMGPGVRVLISK
jgi:large subunit ribosomal protein L1